MTTSRSCTAQLLGRQPQLVARTHRHHRDKRSAKQPIGFSPSNTIAGQSTR
jgi:hypothetical protein